MHILTFLLIIQLQYSQKVGGRYLDLFNTLLQDYIDKIMKQNKENEGSLRRDSIKSFQLEKQLEKANDTIKRMELEIKNVRKNATNGQIDLKIMSQDQAAVLAKVEQEKVTMLKDYSQQISDLKGKLSADNKIWMQRFDIRKEQFQEQIKKVKEESSKTIQETKKRFQACSIKQRDDFAKELKQKIDSYQEQKRKTVTQCQNKIFCSKNQFQKKLSSVIDNNNIKIKELEKQHMLSINKLKKSHELELASVKSEVRSEENMHQQTKNKMQTQKNSLKEEIGNLNQKLVKARQTIQQLKRQNYDLTKNLEEQITQNKLDNEEWQRKFQIQQRHYQSQLDNLNKKYEEQASNILKNHFEHIEKLEQNLTFLETKNQEQKELHATQISQIKQIYQQRPSRQQDLANMNQVQDKLLKRMKQIQILKNELKWCRLELDNKEDVYNKIFACEAKQMVPVVPRERRMKFANSMNHREVKSNKNISRI